MSTRSGKHKNGSHRPFASTSHRLRRDHDNAIVSYRTLGAEPVYADTIGYGATFDERIADADAKLPAGEWLRTAVSTPASIFADLQGRAEVLRGNPEWRGSAFVRHERRTVVVP